MSNGSGNPGLLAAGEDWQRIMQTAVRSGAELCRRLGLPARHSDAAADEDFPVFVPQPYLRRIRPRDPRDPLLRQVLGTSAELASAPGFTADPVGDQRAALATGLLKKYAGRALLIATGVCAIHCRYCFRRHFPYGQQAAHQLDEAIAALQADASIEELLLSGGDPLSLSDERLERILDRLESAPHLKRLRIHTRLPIAIPQRVTRRLCARLRKSHLTCWVVVHANHAQELDEATGSALGRLVDAGLPVLNQAVLLRGVNDSLEALVDLSLSLINLRVSPYYLHILDPVDGAAHFEVDETRAIELVESLRGRLPGYAVPRLAQETPGDVGKRFLA